MRWWEAGLPGNDEKGVATTDTPGGDQRSIMREVLAGMLPAEEVDLLEVSPGQWYLPGTPP